MNIVIASKQQCVGTSSFIDRYYNDCFEECKEYEICDESRKMVLFNGKEIYLTAVDNIYDYDDQFPSIVDCWIRGYDSFCIIYDLSR